MIDPGVLRYLGGVSDYRDAILELITRWGYERREEAFQLSSGSMTHDYIDAKLAIATSHRLRAVGEAFLALAREESVEFDAVGGLTMGADPISLAITIASPDEKLWFSVRKEAKAHGKQRSIEGAALKPGTKVMLVDDVVTTGRSILQALDAVEAAEAEVVFATTLVDRGESTSARMAERGVHYRPLLTYKDLGIEPVPDAVLT